MLSLALDTSSTIAVSVVNDGEVLAAAREDAPRAHAELLADLVRRSLDEAGATGADLKEIVVGTGPAPFTGLRVGIVTARMLGRVWGVEVVGVCSLDALGTEACASAASATVVTDARRREVYWATYVAGRRVGDPQVGAPGDVPGGETVVGRGALLYPEAFAAAPTLLDPDPRWLVEAAWVAREAGDTEFPTEPLYLRRPDVHGVPTG